MRVPLGVTIRNIDCPYQEIRISPAEAAPTISIRAQAPRIRRIVHRSGKDEGRKSRGLCRPGLTGKPPVRLLDPANPGKTGVAGQRPSGTSEDDSVLDIQAELHDAGQPYQDLYEAVVELKRRHDLHPCAVR